MPAGSKKGERRGGRKKGVPNKTTLEKSRRLSDLAQEYTVEAIETLIFHMRNKKKTPELSLRAANIILDRAHGTPIQSVQLGPDDQQREIKFTMTFGSPGSAGKK